MVRDLHCIRLAWEFALHLHKFAWYWLENCTCSNFASYWPEICIVCAQICMILAWKIACVQIMYNIGPKFVLNCIDPRICIACARIYMILSWKLHMRKFCITLARYLYYIILHAPEFAWYWPEELYVFEFCIILARDLHFIVLHWLKNLHCIALAWELAHVHKFYMILAQKLHVPESA